MTGGCGFDPRPGHTKDFKMVLAAIMNVLVISTFFLALFLLDFPGICFKNIL